MGMGVTSVMFVMRKPTALSALTAASLPGLDPSQNFQVLKPILKGRVTCSFRCNLCSEGVLLRHHETRAAAVAAKAPPADQ